MPSLERWFVVSKLYKANAKLFFVVERCTILARTWGLAIAQTIAIDSKQSNDFGVFELRWRTTSIIGTILIVSLIGNTFRSKQISPALSEGYASANLTLIFKFSNRTIFGKTKFLRIKINWGAQKMQPNKSCFLLGKKLLSWKLFSLQ